MRFVAFNEVDWRLYETAGLTAFARPSVFTSIFSWVCPTDYYLLKKLLAPLPNYLIVRPGRISDASSHRKDARERSNVHLLRTICHNR